MVEGTGLKSMASRSLQWHYLPTKFNKSLPIGSKVIRGDTQTDRQTDGQTDRQTGDLISLTFLFKEIRLKTAATFNGIIRNSHKRNMVLFTTLI
jgi:hypothetical protein